MHYDKTGDGWGRGDAVWASTAKRGNCTDFHSLFIGMMRSSGIPARFEMGFSLPEGKTESDIAGYHCWAEFYLNGPGWVPVDATEAWKIPPNAIISSAPTTLTAFSLLTAATSASPLIKKATRSTISSTPTRKSTGNK